ncbi:MAG: hypothetical protein V2B18_14730 [Pseudomonadota bacterium]
MLIQEGLFFQDDAGVSRGRYYLCPFAVAIPDLIRHNGIQEVADVPCTIKRIIHP